MKISRWWERRKQVLRGSDATSDGPDRPELSRKDILAFIIALIQLFLPLIIGLIIVGAIVAWILR